MKKWCDIWKRFFGLVLLVVVMGISLSGCASMRNWCGTEKEQQQIISSAQPQPEVRPAPAPAPPPPAPAPAPPKKARN